MRCEILLTKDMAQRGQKMLEAMVSTAQSVGIKAQVNMTGYRGDCDLLMTYGTGHIARRRYLKAHAKQGKHWIGWDLGYWHRFENDTFTMRMTIDHDHPQKWIRPEHSHRWSASNIQLRNDYDKDGHILLIGQGPKQCAISREHFMAWEKRTLAQLQTTYPGRQIIFRPKRPDFPGLDTVPSDATSSIGELLKGASLAVMHHSNVGVDACIAGVPVVTEDGAASALYGSDLKNPIQPTHSERLKFLESLAYWQWTPEEAAETWKYLINRLSD